MVGLVAAFGMVAALFFLLPGLLSGGGGTCPPPEVPPPAPESPTNLTLVRSLGSLTLAWSPAANQSEAGVEYEIRSNRSGTMMTERDVACGGVTTFELGGLPTGFTVAMSVRARSPSGRGNWSHVVVATTSPGRLRGRGGLAPD